jgi:hypothetical protein
MVLTLMVHMPHILEAGWVVDDTRNLSQHARDGDIAGEWSSPTYAHAGGEQGHIWRPVPATAQHLVATLFGRDPSVFRGLNLALHMVNIGLLFFWMRGRSNPRVTGLLITVWAAHPALVESVAWNSDIYDVMACTVALLMLWALDRYRSIVVRASWLAGGILMACLCKESSVALVGLVWVLLWLDPRPKESPRQRVIMGSAALAGAVLWMLWRGAITTDSYGGALSETPLTHQVQNLLSATGWLLVPPNRAWFAHLFEPGVSPEVITGMVTIGAMALGSWALARRQMNEGRTLALVGLAWVGLLVPAGIGMALIGIQSLRYIYLPLAIVVGLLGGMGGLIERRPRAWLLGIGIFSLSGFALGSLRLSAWQNDTTLWEAELTREPENPWALAGLGRARIGEGRAEEGVALWEQAINIAPPGIKLFPLQDQRNQLAHTAMGLARAGELLAGETLSEDPPLDIESATSLTLRMTSQMLRAHREQDLPLPDDYCIMVADCWELRGYPGRAMVIRRDHCSTSFEEP